MCAAADPSPRYSAGRGRLGARLTAPVEAVVDGTHDRRDVGRCFVALLDDLGFRASLRVLGAGYFKRIYDARTRAQIGLVGFGPDYLSPSTLIQPNFACASLAERRPENASYFCDPLLARQVDRALASQGAGNVQHHLQWFTLLDQLWVR